MPKSKTELLRVELEKVGLELLDVYSFKDTDYIRVKYKLGMNVVIYESKRKVNTLTSIEDVRALALDIAKKASTVK